MRDPLTANGNVQASNEDRRPRNDMSNPRAPREPRVTYPFRLRDPVSGIWVRARFIAKLKDVGDCLAAWEIVAPPLEAKPRG